MTPDERQIEDLLRRSRPVPRAAWRAQAERELFGEPRPARRWFRLPAVRVGAGLATGLATVLLVLGLAGTGPLDVSGSDEVRAKESCRYVTVTRMQRTPILVTGKRGTPRVKYRKRPVQRTVRRCSQP